MAGEDIYPPDQLTAGAPPDMPEMPGLLSALRFQGSVPGNLMDSMAPPPSSSMGMAIAAALAGGANPGGPNPILQQIQLLDAQQGRHTQQLFNAQNVLYDNQMAQARLMQQAERERQQALVAKNKAGFEALGVMARDPNISAETRGPLAQQHQAKAKEYLGIDIPTSWFDVAVPVKERNHMLLDMQSGLTPENLKKQYHWLTDAEIPTYQAMLQNAEGLRQIGAQTPADLQKEAAEVSLKRSEAFFKAHPEFEKTARFPSLPGYANEFALTQAQMPLDQLDTTTDLGRALIDSALKYARAKSLTDERDETLRTLDTKEKTLDLQLTKDKSLAEFTAGLRADAKGAPKALTVAEQVKLAKDLTVADGRTMLLDGIDSALGLIDKVDKKGLLPQPGSVLGGALPAVRRLVTQRYDQDWQDFSLRWAQLEIGQIARNLYDEKGVRSIQAFGKQLKVTDEPPPKATLVQYLTFVKGQVLKSAQNDLLNRQAAGYAPDLLEAIQEKYQPYLGGAPAGPLTPSAPPIKGVLTPERYQQAKAKGYSDEAIRAQGYGIPP